VSARVPTQTAGGFCSREVEEAAAGRLRRKPFFPASRVSCEYISGVLRLRGRVSSYYQKQIAQEVVKGLEGVRDIVNEIEVTR
jgi:osmotically-inducible protein OsmY